jgi:deazaflavin-dependent oxidoreductase (nitroreductase family)
VVETGQRRLEAALAHVAPRAHDVGPDLDLHGTIQDTDLPTRIGLALLHVHQAIYEYSDGRIGEHLLGVPCLLLRTTGRRTGKTRTSSLVYARDGGDYLVVASLGGADETPAWLHNVRARAQVEVQIGRVRFAATATIVERDDPDHARLWSIVNENNHGRYDRYQLKTARPIPVVRLSR